MPDPTVAEVAALAAARRYCGWHVVGAVTEDITVDGPGSSLLVLPTLRLTDVTAVTENDTAVELDSIEWSARGLIVKCGRGWWTDRFRGITVSVTHGYAEAPDFDAAVAAIAERTADGLNGEANVIGPFQYSAVSAMFSLAEKSILDLYRLEPTP
jgi:hypothetical protein